MTREEHLAYCKICTNQKLDLNVGLVCSLTGQLADFEHSCPDFVRDEVAEQVEFERKMAATGDYQSGDSLDYKKNKRMGALTFVVGCLVTIISHLYIDQSGLAVITYGAILYGAFQYYRGTQQEKIALEHEKK